MKMRIRAELSRKNKYWIDKNRYYELKYFCLQYPTWKKEYEMLDGFSSCSFISLLKTKTNSINDTTYRTAEDREHILECMKVVEQASIGADPELSSYILKAVTEGLSYDYLKMNMDIPCSRDTYYDRYRRFFWLLSNSR